MRMVAKDAVVTVDRADGFRVLESFGYVSGAAVRPQNVLRATFRSIGAFIGLAPVEYLTDAERMREDALEDLRRGASLLGANAVLDLQFHVSEEPDGSTRVLAFGRAVRLARQTAKEVRSAS
ncbi:MAG: heavy metal-binding domain-containing protein [Vulcanimicrobiaceae bacterium]